MRSKRIAILAICVVVGLLPMRAATPTPTTFFLHASSAPINQIDTATFDTNRPTASGLNALAPGNQTLDPLYPTWTGSIGAVINTLKMDFWQTAPVDQALLSEVNYDVSLTVGKKTYAFPTFTEENGPPGIPVEVVHSFTAHQPGSPLPIDAGSGPVTLTIAGHFTDGEAVTLIAYDSTDYPSGFTVNALVQETPPPPMARTIPSRMTFSPTTLVDPQFFPSEPSVWVDGDGRVFVSAISGFSNATSFVWRSTDGGRTFELLDARLPAVGIDDPRHRPCTLSGGGGDTDIVTDRTGRVYLADLEAAGIAMNWSTDHGDTWDCNTLASTDIPPAEDRQWLAPAPTADDGPAIDAFHSYLLIGQGTMAIDATRDGGATWERQSEYSPASQSGALFTGSDGTLYHGFYNGTTIYLARSVDQGKTFKLLTVSKRTVDPGNEFPVADVDAAGNLYMTWVEGETFDVLFTRSTDRGEHWTTPVRLNPPASDTSVFPWLTAGKAGDVSVAWYGTAEKGTPDDQPDTTRWNVWIARTVDGTATNPVFQVGPMTQTPMHFGSICTMGLFCDVIQADRSLGDFFEIHYMKDGALIAAFNDNARSYHNATGGFPGPYAVVVRQESGLGMPSATAVSARAKEAKGDAMFPTHDPNGEDVPALDVTAPTASVANASTLRVQFTVSDAKDLTSALSAAGSGAATDAYWLAIWWAHDKREYVGMHVSALTGGPEFFGGDEPKAVSREPNNDKYASYPATFAPTGTVDETTGRVTIEAPLSEFGLHADDDLHGLQVFSMTGLLPARTLYTPLDVVDATPAVSSLLTTRVLGTKETRTVNRRVHGEQLAATGVSDPVVPAVLLVVAALATAITRRRFRT